MITPVIVGVGVSTFRKGGGDDDPGLVSLGIDAVRAALDDAGVSLDAARVDAAYVATSYGGSLPGQRILGELGFSGIPIVNVENACAGGATALNEAVWGVRAGRYGSVLALGVEELSRLGKGTLPLVEEDEEVRHGLVMPAVYAMRARRYMHDYGLSLETLAHVVVKSRSNAIHNRHARFRSAVSIEEVLESRTIASPLTLLQCSANSDGAAAALITSESVAKSFDAHPLRVAASQLNSGRFSTGHVDMTWMRITEEALAAAFREAELDTEDLDLCEVHDAFSIAEIIYCEMLGLAPRGQGGDLIRSGATEIDGRVAVNPSGGLLSRGHPVAATGLAQLAEITWQLRGECGERQVPGKPRIGLAHVTGGGIAGFENAACGVHILVDDAR